MKNTMRPTLLLFLCLVPFTSNTHTITLKDIKTAIDIPFTSVCCLVTAKITKNYLKNAYNQSKYLCKDNSSISKHTLYNLSQGVFITLATTTFCIQKIKNYRLGKDVYKILSDTTDKLWKKLVG
jgi:uncharacterized membrane protein